MRHNDLSRIRDGLVIAFFLFCHGIGFFLFSFAGLYLFFFDLFLLILLFLNVKIVTLIFPVHIKYPKIIFGFFLSALFYAAVNFLVSHHLAHSVFLFEKLSVSFLCFFLLFNHRLVRNFIDRNKFISEIEFMVAHLFRDWQIVLKRKLPLRDKLVVFLRMNIKKL